LKSLFRTTLPAGFWIVLLLVFVSRLPFLLPGFGSEEDAWGLYYIARKVALSGAYEVSRLPGHPLQEAVYILLWKQGAPAFNLLTALFATVATGFFMAALRKLKVPHAHIAGMAFAFIPVVYINSCNAMDYLWAMAFLMAAFYMAAGSRWWAAGLLIGLAAGCRITSLAMVVPLTFLAGGNPGGASQRKAFLKLALASAVSAFLVFIPVIMAYGFSFFTFTAQIPVGWHKAVFNATLGVWGVIGFVDLCFALLLLFRIRKSAPTLPRGLLHCCLAVFVIHAAAYGALPQKAAFFIPALPFVVLLLAWHFPRRYLTAFSFSMIFSAFFIGIHLDDDNRGAGSSPWSVHFAVAGKPLALDFLRGPVMAERQKRINKIEFSEKAAQRIGALQGPAVVIAGFWSSDVLAKMDAPPAGVRLVYYEPEDSLAVWTRAGASVYYLPEQATYNDKAFGGAFTGKYAVELKVE
jgi:hypothetical protein